MTSHRNSGTVTTALFISVPLSLGQNALANVCECIEALRF